jgi:hypothetical protein
MSQLRTRVENAISPLLPHGRVRVEDVARGASRRIAGTPTHGYEPTLKGVMAAFAKSWRRE